MHDEFEFFYWMCMLGFLGFFIGEIYTYIVQRLLAAAKN